MTVLPRIRMRARLKLFNADRTGFSVGTVMLRQGVYNYAIRFDDSTLRSVSLEDTTTWEFLPKPTTGKVIPPTNARKTFQYSVPSVPSLSFEGVAAKTGPEDKLPSPAVSSSATEKDGSCENINQKASNFNMNENQRVPQENFNHLDSTPIVKHPPRMISGKGAEPSRSLQYPSFRKKEVPPRKRLSQYKEVRFGDPTIILFDAETGRTENSISEEPVANKREGSTSNPSEVVLERSSLQPNTSHVRGHDDDNQKPRVVKPVEHKKMNKVKKVRDSARISSLRKRNLEGRVVKSSSDIKMRTRPRRIRACQQTQNRVDVSSEPALNETETVPTKPDGIGSQSEQKTAEETEVEESQQKIETEDVKSVETVKPVDEMEIKRRMAASIERLATIHTQQIINHIASQEDFFHLFPRMEYTEIGNKYYEDHYDFMFEYLPSIMRDAIRLAEICIEPGEDISLDNVVTFLDHQVSWAADRFTEIRIVEINRGIDNKRKEMKSMTERSSDGIQSASGSASG